MLIKGNKMDMEEGRSIKKEVSETITTIDWEHGYVECSAKHNDNIDMIFKDLMTQAKVPGINSFSLSRNKRSKSLPGLHGSGNRTGLRKKRNTCSLS